MRTGRHLSRNGGSNKGETLFPDQGEIMDAMVTYDVSGKQDQVKAVMLARGYRDYRGFPDGRQRLPDATLWRRNTELLQALQDIKTAANECQVTLERAVVVPSGR